MNVFDSFSAESIVCSPDVCSSFLRTTLLFKSRPSLKNVKSLKNYKQKKPMQALKAHCVEKTT